MFRSTDLALAMFVLSGFSLGSTAWADEAVSRDESSWTALVDEPSRADLFQQDVIPAGMAAADAAAKAAGDTLTSLALPATFQFPRDAIKDTIKNEVRKDVFFGVDVSHYTSPSLLLDSLKDESVKFIYVKATQGATLKDDNFADFWTRLAGSASVGKDGVHRKGVPADARIPRGAYHFLSSSTPGLAQANAFVDYVTLHGGFKPDDLPPVVDLEWDATKTVKDQWVGHSADEIVKNVLACLKQIEARTHRKPMLYTAKSWFSNDTVPLSRIGEFGDFPIWIADFNARDQRLEKPTVGDLPNRALWQFTDRSLAPTIGVVSVKDGLDASIFFGDDQAFLKAFGLPQ